MSVPRRPASAVALVSVLFFLGVTALAGGIELLVFRHGNSYLPETWLDRIPVVDSYVAPGLVLGTVFGLGSLAAAVGVLRKPAWRALEPLERRTGRHWSWSASVALGVAFVGWQVLQVALLGGAEAPGGG